MIMMILLIVHLIITSLTIIICYKGTSKLQILLKSLIALMLPIGGALIVILLTLGEKNEVKHIGMDYEVDEILLFTDNIIANNYKNIVSIEEALILNKDSIKRQQIIEQLKKDSLNYIEVLKKAVKDEDVETSHYASSAIVEIKRKLEVEIQRFSIEYKINKDNIEFVENYKEVIKSYIISNLIDKYSLEKYTQTYIKLLERILSVKKDKENYKDLIHVLIKNNDLVKAKQYSLEFLEVIPSEEAYIEALKLFYTTKDVSNFKKVFNELISSSIELSPQGIEKVRVWGKWGGSNDI